MHHGDPLLSYALRQAEADATSDQFDTGLEWLERVDPNRRPLALEVRLLEGAAKMAAAAGQWQRSATLVERRLRLADDRLLRLRLEALRVRKATMPDDQWRTVGAKVPASTRLAENSIPGLVGVWAAGAYFSRGSRRGDPWSQFLRSAKHPDENDEGWVMLSLGCRYAARYLLERTPVLRSIDAVVAIPARPARYVDRMMALPDELAKTLRSDLGLPYLSDGLSSTVDDLEMKRLSHVERRRAIRGSMAVGKTALLAGKVVLVVDDVITTGATLGEAADRLSTAGVRAVFGFALAHTEG